MRTKPSLLILAIAAAVLLAAPAHALDIFVDFESGSDCGQASCGEVGRPYRTIAFALQATLDNLGADVIRVSEGTYMENIEITSDVGDFGVTLLGGYPARFVGYDANDPEATRNPATNLTIIDGQGMDNVVGIQDSMNITMDGFIIRNGRAAGLNNKRGGGGIYIEDSLVFIRNNRIEDNVVVPPRFRGGGITILYGSNYQNFTESEITGNTIVGNTTESGDGGGIAVYVLPPPDPRDPHPTAPLIQGNIIENNTAQAQAGETAFGGGVFISGNLTRLVDNPSIRGNQVLALQDACEPGNPTGKPSGNGGGVAVLLGSPVITGNTIAENSARTAPGDALRCALQAQGGGFYANAFYGTLDGNIIEGNTTYGGTGFGNDQGILHSLGGGVNITFGAPSAAVTNNVIRGNVTEGGGSSSAFGAGAYLYNFSGSFSGNVVESNTSPTDTGGLSVFIAENSGVTEARVEDNLITQNRAVRDGGASVFDFAGVLEFRHNQIQSNTASGANAVAGLSVRGDATLTNVEVVDNDGHGLLMAGNSTFPTAATLQFATIANNNGTGLLTLFASPSALRYSILSGNTGSNIFDLETNQTFHPDFTVDHTLIEGVVAPGDGNLDLDPLFVTGPAGDYLLSNTRANEASDSPAVDASGVLAVDFGLETRTTRTDDIADFCTADLGFHYVSAVVQADSDADGLPDDAEIQIGSDPNDADTDNDGVLDGFDCLADIDGDTLLGLFDCDQDGDGLHDGTEAGVDDGNKHPDTESGVLCDEDGDGIDDQFAFLPDTDTSTTTDYRDADTDDGGETDGEEDVNLNGRVDAGESDPNVESDDDPDQDGLTNLVERLAGTDPLDYDSDDDGVNDGLEGLTDTDGDTVIDALDCDSDEDGLFDGTEVGRVEADLTPATDTAAGCWIPDADPSTTTNPRNADTDGGGCADGSEDLNQNGAVDGVESDPNNGGDDGNCDPPGEPFILNMRKAGTDLLVDISSGERAVWHRLYRGSLSAFAGTPASWDHLASDGPDATPDTGDEVGHCRLMLPDLTLTDPAVLGDGTSAYYLATAGNVSGEGTYGTDSSGADRPAGDASGCP